ncbi:MAG: hypothetical protein AAF682_00795 [Planctomycetota bacterium]
MAPQSDPKEDNLEKVRDLLFGKEAQKSAKRITQLEQKVTRELADVRKDLKRQMDSLEDYVRGEIETLLERISDEKLAREAEKKELSARITETGRAVGKRVTALQDQTAANFREHRKQLLEQSKALRGEIEQGREELGAEVDEELAELRESSIPRAELAQFLADLAMKLGGKGAGK